MNDDKRKEPPISFKHKEIKAYVKQVWKEKPHLKTRSQVVRKIFREHQEIPKLKQELEKYRKTVEFVSQGSSKEVSTLEQTLESKYPCLSRFRHEGSFFCVPRKGKAILLETLKICSACSGRLLKESEVEVLRTRQYVTCGAKEHHDKKKGLMLYCEKLFGGNYVSIEDCKSSQCMFLKEVQVR